MEKIEDFIRKTIFFENKKHLVKEQKIKFYKENDLKEDINYIFKEYIIIFYSSISPKENITIFNHADEIDFLIKYTTSGHIWICTKTWEIMTFNYHVKYNDIYEFIDHYFTNHFKIKKYTDRIILTD